MIVLIQHSAGEDASPHFTAQHEGTGKKLYLSLVKESKVPAPIPSFTKGFYRHFKGEMYGAVGIGYDSESEEWLVIYFACYEHEAEPLFYARSLTSFTETLPGEHDPVPRYKFLRKS